MALDVQTAGGHPEVIHHPDAAQAEVDDNQALLLVSDEKKLVAIYAPGRWAWVSKPLPGV